MSTDLQCQQAVHELFRMIERMLSLRIDPSERDASVTFEPEDIDRIGLMVARLERLTGRLAPSDERSEFRRRHAALAKYLAVLQT